MSRSTFFVSKEPAGWDNLLQDLSNSKIYLLARNGPSVFLLKDDSGATFRCTLGNPHSCSCSKPVSRKPKPILQNSKTKSKEKNEEVRTHQEPSPRSTNENENNMNSDNLDEDSNIEAVTENCNLCIHVAYCLIKVLKVPKSHTLCYQTSLTDTEVWKKVFNIKL